MTATTRRRAPLDLGFQDVDAEVASFADDCRPPDGTFVRARAREADVDRGGLRRLSESAHEGNRLYVVPVHRGGGMGGRIAEALVRLCAVPYRDGDCRDDGVSGRGSTYNVME